MKAFEGPSGHGPRPLENAGRGSEGRRLAKSATLGPTSVPECPDPDGRPDFIGMTLILRQAQDERSSP